MNKISAAIVCVGLAFASIYCDSIHQHNSSVFYAIGAFLAFCAL